MSEVSPLRGLRNKVLCLYFGAPRWCDPCRKVSQPGPGGKRSPLARIEAALRDRQV